jgi:hypothetical protein
MYSHDVGIDVDEWRDRIGIETGKTKPAVRASIDTVVEMVERVSVSVNGQNNGSIAKVKLVKAIREETGVSSAYAYKLVAQTETQNLISRHKDGGYFIKPKPNFSDCMNKRNYRNSTRAGGRVEE